MHIFKVVALHYQLSIIAVALHYQWDSRGYDSYLFLYAELSNKDIFNFV